MRGSFRALDDEKSGCHPMETECGMMERCRTPTKSEQRKIPIGKIPTDPAPMAHATVSKTASGKKGGGKVRARCRQVFEPQGPARQPMASRILGRKKVASR